MVVGAGEYETESAATGAIAGVVVCVVSRVVDVIGVGAAEDSSEEDGVGRAEKSKAGALEKSKEGAFLSCLSSCFSSIRLEARIFNSPGSFLDTWAGGTGAAVKPVVLLAVGGIV